MEPSPNRWTEVLVYCSPTETADFTANRRDWTGSLQARRMLNGDGPILETLVTLTAQTQLP